MHADPLAVVIVALSVHLAVDAVNGVDLSGRFVSAVELGRGYQHLAEELVGGHALDLLVPVAVLLHDCEAAAVDRDDLVSLIEASVVIPYHVVVSDGHLDTEPVVCGIRAGRGGASSSGTGVEQGGPCEIVGLPVVPVIPVIVIVVVVQALELVDDTVTADPYGGSVIEVEHVVVVPHVRVDGAVHGPEVGLDRLGSDLSAGPVVLHQLDEVGCGHPIGVVVSVLPDEDVVPIDPDDSVCLPVAVVVIVLDVLDVVAHLEIGSEVVAGGRGLVGDVAAVAGDAPVDKVGAGEGGGERLAGGSGGHRDLGLVDHVAVLPDPVVCVDDGAVTDGLLVEVDHAFDVAHACADGLGPLVLAYEVLGDADVIQVVFLAHGLGILRPCAGRHVNRQEVPLHGGYLVSGLLRGVGPESGRLS